jgi:hypothetical protein
LLPLPVPPWARGTRDGIRDWLRSLGIEVSSRTIESWDIPYRLLNGRAVYERDDVHAFAQDRFGKAPVHRGRKDRSTGQLLAGAIVRGSSRRTAGTGHARPVPPRP